MPWYEDPKIIITLIGVAVNAMFFIVIKFNDLRHLGKKVDKMEEKQDKMAEDIVDVKERVATIEGKFEAYED